MNKVVLYSYLEQYCLDICHIFQTPATPKPAKEKSIGMETPQQNNSAGLHLRRQQVIIQMYGVVAETVSRGVNV